MKHDQSSISTRVFQSGTNTSTSFPTFQPKSLPIKERIKAYGCLMMISQFKAPLFRHLHHRYKKVMSTWKRHSKTKLSGLSVSYRFSNLFFLCEHWCSEREGNGQQRWGVRHLISEEPRHGKIHFGAIGHLHTVLQHPRGVSERNVSAYSTTKPCLLQSTFSAFTIRQSQKKLKKCNTTFEVWGDFLVTNNVHSGERWL